MLNLKRAAAACLRALAERLDPAPRTGHYTTGAWPVASFDTAPSASAVVTWLRTG